METGLVGRRAAVAAATRGLGWACASALVAEGAQVAICGRNEGRVREAANRLGPAAIPLVADLGDPGQAGGFVAAALEALGGLDILVTNGGGPAPGSFASVRLDEYPGALAMNLLSVVAMCQEAIPTMRAQRFGRVVAITSVAARQPIPTLILSNTARSAATAFLKTLSTEVAADGVTVNSVQPGIHNTEGLRDEYGDDLTRLETSVPSGSLGKAVDFGAVVAFLCSDQARYITGAAIPVDGGYSAGLQ